MIYNRRLLFCSLGGTISHCFCSAFAQQCQLSWTPIGTGLSNLSFANAAYSLVPFDDGSGTALFATGQFGEAGPVNLNNNAIWRGTQWLRAGATGIGRSHAVLDPGNGPILHVGAQEGVYRWTGNAWAQLPGTQLAANSFAVFDDGTGPSLYAGIGSLALGAGPGNVFRRNGKAWNVVGGGISVSPTPQLSQPRVLALAVHDDDGPGPIRPALYVGGSFLRAGAVQVNNIARWDGTAWSNVGGGVTRPSPIGLEVRALFSANEPSGPVLYIGGLFETGGAPAVPSINVARWNGINYLQPVPAIGPSEFVASFAQFDDGAGPALYIGGVFSQHGPVNVLKWDGTTVTGLGPPASATGQVYTMLPYDDGRGPALFVGGTFSTIGGISALSVARWGRPPCRANCDGSLGPTGCATLNVNDFFCFLNLFAVGDARANCDGGGTPPTLNVNDFICYINAFAAGCS